MDALISLNNQIPVVYVNKVFVFINSFHKIPEYRKKQAFLNIFDDILIIWVTQNHIFCSIYFGSTLRSQLKMFDEQYSMRKRSKRKETTSGDPIFSYVYV